MEAIASKKIVEIIDLTNFEEGMKEFADSDMEMLEVDIDGVEWVIKKMSQNKTVYSITRNGKYSEITSDIWKMKSKMKIR